MRLLLFVLVVVLVSACGGSRQAGKDYTRNSSRTKTTYKKPDNKKVTSTPSSEASEAISTAPDKKNRGAGATDDVYHNESANSGRAERKEKKSAAAVDEVRAEKSADARLSNELVLNAESLIGTKYRYGGHESFPGF